MWKPGACLAGLVAMLAAPACMERPASNAPRVAGVTPAAQSPSVAGALRFIEDDASRALAEARRRGVPLFVEAWAPW